ncbi:MAG TPA: ABC transporter substrate-binding protein, partial [Acidimicrobiia bacterium]|nr:ABC transporter substrate-binding protein [Acidimicrobiia bacterium]
MRARLGLLIVVLVLALPACGGSASESRPNRDERNATNAATIKIGALLALSGSNAEAGANMLNAARLAADDLNAAGGVLGRQIEIVSADDGCNPEVATAAAENILASGIVGVAGGFCSGAATPTIPLARMFSAAAVATSGLQPSSAET